MFVFAIRISHSEFRSLQAKKKFSKAELEENEGIIPRMLMDISKLWEDTATKTVLHVSFMEIYNDKVRDLLADGKAFDEPEV